MSTLRAALESALAENPHDLASHMAYADLLVEEGDPRGEFIQVQLALEDPRRGPDERAELELREEELLAAHKADWIGEAALVFLLSSKEGQRMLPEWPFGLQYFMGSDGNKIYLARGWIDCIDLGDFTTSLLEALCRSPCISLLQEVIVRGLHSEEGANLSQCPWPNVSGLRAFQLGNEDGFAPLNGQGIVDLIPKMKRIEELRLYAHGVDTQRLFSLPMPYLRALTVHCLTEYPLEVLAANPSLGNLQLLSCWPHAQIFGDEGAYIRADGFIAIVRSPHLRSLTHLSLYLSDIGDEGIAALVESGLLRRLRVLDLWNGRISDAGARILASCPDLRGLQRLRLAKNQLTADGIAVLQATGVALEVEEQYTAHQIAQTAYLWEGDME